MGNAYRYPIINYTAFLHLVQLKVFELNIEGGRQGELSDFFFTIFKCCQINSFTVNKQYWSNKVKEGKEEIFQSTCASHDDDIDGVDGEVVVQALECELQYYFKIK